MQSQGWFNCQYLLWTPTNFLLCVLNVSLFPSKYYVNELSLLITTAAAATSWKQPENFYKLAFISGFHSTLAFDLNVICRDSTCKFGARDSAHSQKFGANTFFVSRTVCVYQFFQYATYVYKKLSQGRSEIAQYLLMTPARRVLINNP